MAVSRYIPPPSHGSIGQTPIGRPSLPPPHPAPPPLPLHHHHHPLPPPPSRPLPINYVRPTQHHDNESRRYWNGHDQNEHNIYRNRQYPVHNAHESRVSISNGRNRPPVYEKWKIKKGTGPQQRPWLEPSFKEMKLPDGERERLARRRSTMDQGMKEYRELSSDQQESIEILLEQKEATNSRTEWEWVRVEVIKEPSARRGGYVIEITAIKVIIKQVDEVVPRHPRAMSLPNSRHPPRPFIREIRPPHSERAVSYRPEPAYPPQHHSLHHPVAESYHQPLVLSRSSTSGRAPRLLDNVACDYHNPYRPPPARPVTFMEPNWSTPYPVHIPNAQTYYPPPSGAPLPPTASYSHSDTSHTDGRTYARSEDSYYMVGDMNDLNIRDGGKRRRGSLSRKCALPSQCYPVEVHNDTVTERDESGSENNSQGLSSSWDRMDDASLSSLPSTSPTMYSNRSRNIQSRNEEVVYTGGSVGKADNSRRFSGQNAETITRSRRLSQSNNSQIETTNENRRHEQLQRHSASGLQHGGQARLPSPPPGPSHPANTATQHTSKPSFGHGNASERAGLSDGSNVSEQHFVDLNEQRGKGKENEWEQDGVWRH